VKIWVITEGVLYPFYDFVTGLVGLTEKSRQMGDIGYPALGGGWVRVDRGGGFMGQCYKDATSTEVVMR
jgi:hypothetical protein